MKMSRAWAMPNPATFSIPPIEALLMRYLESAVNDYVVDPFARNSTLATFANDLNPDTSAEYHMDAVEFLQMLYKNEIRAQVVLIDPPYSPRQISECYKQVGREVGMQETQNARLYKAVKDAADPLVKVGGIVICCGWNSAGMGKTRGYELEEILLVAHGGAHNDTIVTVERKK